MTIAAPLTPWACETAGPVRPMTGSAVPNSTRAPGRVCRVATVGPLDGGPTVTQLRVLDLFSGIGGFSLGLERTGGFKTVQFCEIDAFCRRVLAKHWPDVPCHDDVTTMQFHEGMADVVTGGFPCQDISFAGKGAGLAGERSGLYRHLVDAIRVVRPRYAILENVAALLSRGLGDVLGDLAAIGYDAECHCIPASAVGAPHRRDRIWIVAHAHGERKPQSQGAVAIQRGRLGYLRQAQPHPHAAPLQWPAFLGHEQDRDHAGAGEMADAASLGLQGAGHVQGADCRGQEAGQPLVCGEGIGRHGSVESRVRGMAHGLSEGSHGGRVDVVEVGCEKAGAAFAADTGRPEMRSLRNAKQSSAASPGLFGAGSVRGSMRALPCGGGQTGRSPDIEGPDCLQGMRSELPAEAQQEAHDMQPRVPGGNRQAQRHETMGSQWRNGEWPDTPRVARGVPKRVDRLRSLGNSIVPQIAELIGRALLQADHRVAA